MYNWELHGQAMQYDEYAKQIMAYLVPATKD